MKTYNSLIMKKYLLNAIGVLWFSSTLLTSCTPSDKPVVERDLGDGIEAFYGIEINGQLCGYKEMKSVPVLTNLGEMNRVKQKSHVRMNLMGKKMFTNIDNESFFDTSFRHLVYSSSSIKQGKLQLKSMVKIQGDTAFITVTGQENKEVLLPAGILFENGIYRKDLVLAFSHDSAVPHKVEFFNEVKAVIDVKTYRWKGRRTLTLVDKTYHTICVEEVNHSSGEQTELWLDEGTGLVVQGIYLTSGIRMFLAEHEIMNRIVASRVDDILFYSVNEVIPDFESLSYMKVYMVINSSGDSLSHEELNYPGQIFTGTVTNNIIDGIFEISHQRYDGAGAPGYPYDLDLDSTMQRFVEPEFLIESDNSKIRGQAEEILGDDVSDSWDAVKRLSHWVGTKIRGAIPGGGSALGTLKVMEGECGGHSRLLIALCRSLGIPARSSVGCMYVPDNGGFFGQHMWTEVYMGEAGWIPVDATIKEFDYIDSGHIRLAEFSTFHPQEVKILRYKTESKDVSFEEDHTSENEQDIK